MRKIVTYFFCLFFVIFIPLIYKGLFLDLKAAEVVDPSKIEERRLQLEAELSRLESEIENQRKIIEKKQREATSLERDIAILDAQINKARLEIKARSLRISRLNDAINERADLISELEDKLSSERLSLAELLRRVNELDSVNLVEIVLGYNTLSEFFKDFDSFESIQKQMQISFKEIKNTRIKTAKEKKGLEEKKAEELELRKLQLLEKKRLEEREKEKKRILKITKGQERRYKKILAARQKDAAAIRSQLFLLRGSPAISFEKAVSYANIAWKATGVRPAFLLAIIKEESDLGANVGKGNWKKDLAHYKCRSQKRAFLLITSELGLDPDLMPVSKKTWYGHCGGAMGPAQFMPTTWQLYKNKIAKITGHNPPNPWDPLDAFVGAALLLRDNGAAAGGYTAERRAALRYLAGSHWRNPAYSFYGDDVMFLAKKYQEQIDIIR